MQRCDINSILIIEVVFIFKNTYRISLLLYLKLFIIYMH